MELLFDRPPAFVPADRQKVVCNCGAFLCPVWAADGTCSVRLMTIEEVAELPDEVRNRMVAARRELSERANED
jgi:hypothetical protein